MPRTWLLTLLQLQMATDQSHVPRVHVPMLSDPEGLDRTLDPEDLEQ